MLNTVDPNTILGAQAGRPEQVTALYEHYHAGIYRYLYYRVGDRQTAEDLTSEVFLRMIRNLKGYRLQGSMGPFQAWLFQIAHNLAMIISGVRAASLRYPWWNTWKRSSPGRMRAMSLA
jgi:RNA polymerase sigma factor (sigma-70 family)